MVAGVVLAGLVGCGGDEDEGISTGGAPPPSASPSPSSSANTAPKIQGHPSSHVVVGTAYDFTPQAGDADEDVLTFSVRNQPAWLSFDVTTGRLSGTPDEAHLGQYENILISVTDGDAIASLPAFSITVVPSAAGAATLTWTPPQSRVDGSPVDLAGYRVYWGTASRDYQYTREVGANVATHVVDNLASTTWYFAVTALDAAGMESEYSNEAVKVLR